MSKFSDRRRLVFGLPAALACLALPGARADDVTGWPTPDGGVDGGVDGSAAPATPTSVRQAGALTDYGDPHVVAALARPLALPPEQWTDVFRWLHIGDSHTAGDYLTGELRRRLQARYGDAGIGWITPGYVNGQRSDSVKLSNENGWAVARAARHQLEAAAFPFGGQLGGNVPPPPPPPPKNAKAAAKAAKAAAKAAKAAQKAKQQAAAGPPLPAATSAPGLRLTFKRAEPVQVMRVSVLRSLANNSAELELASDLGPVVGLPAPVPEGGPWQVQHEQVDVGGEHVWLRLRDAKTSAPATVAGIALEKSGPGVVVDAIGVNGAQVDEFLAWSEDALAAALTARPPNVVVLEFGTNEAVGHHFDAVAYVDKVTTAVRRLRQHSSAAIVLMVPPDMHRAAQVGRRRKKPATCGAQPAWLQAVTDALVQVARTEQTLLWDWGQWVRSTGATCGTFSLAHMTPSLARPDYVHFSPEGYRAVAESLLDDVLHLVGVPVADDP